MKRLLGVLVVVLLLGGCGTGGFSGLYDLPLPGGADLGDHPYHVSARFADVLDLVPQASVKVNDVAVGRVDKIELAPDTRSAIVDMRVNGDVKLPANSYADLRQSSLLGEKFVELREPASGAEGTLTDNAVIPLDHTNRNPEVEEVLGALSLLLNGGGVNQLADITRELNKTLTGNEAEIRALLSRVDQLATELDGQKSEIIRAIDGLNRLSSTLTGQTANLSNALDNLAPGLQVLTQQRDQLVGMLQSLDTLSGVAVNTIDQSKDQLIDNLKALTPTLTKLAEAGQNLPTALKILPTYPLPDVAGDVVKGDYANVKARVDLDLSGILQNIENAGRVQIDTPAGTIGIGQGTSSSAPPLPLPQEQPAPTTPSTQDGGLLGNLLGSLLGGNR
ncbi:phospholipid/cholesterol/gamma-HCH transport system substrate-binding protein [Amycolatopsis bartoniae]|uniref:ABC transporter substrate-binding protein n=1 Tax=Amycolatopsis bartoniae TaxID=941986 RepID=A0A8H9J6H4_9PSEU|nr:MCE family protein [Amycolatopsis bartoniae]MBB2937542.1 phospholipid/cholesterol/gamma-HCH transport system substrate-binding protein [Amycolatopsis bartoniae]TVT05941.1 MCE family protein [Amycolatopsis bartoniae]GHF82060.1 ABC transporter substrate-binding protein [Amycolatopsis bartoniae]